VFSFEEKKDSVNCEGNNFQNPVKEIEGVGCRGVIRGVSSGSRVGCDVSFWGVARNGSCTIFTLVYVPSTKPFSHICCHLPATMDPWETNGLFQCMLKCSNRFLFVVSS
jgi:hypothetical protein